LSAPLQGIRVLDLTRLVPGPFCTLVLADLGADVVKIEEPRLGDYLRGMTPMAGAVGARFAALNRGKRSVALDLKAAAGRDALLRMAARADVLVDGFRPGVLDRLGVGADRLRDTNARLIVCAMTGYGSSGPLRERAGHDLCYEALGGIIGQTGQSGDDPTVPGVQAADFVGALWAVIAILGALRARDRTGLGSFLDLSIAESAMTLLCQQIAETAAGEPPARGEDRLTGGLARYGVYRTADGKHLAVAALEPKFWQALNEVLGRPYDASEIEGDQRRIRTELQAIFATRTRAEWERAFAGRDACVAPVLEMTELADHELHRARASLFSLHGTLHVRPPAATARALSPPPALGEHTAEVLCEYGFSDAEIAELQMNREQP